MRYMAEHIPVWPPISELLYSRHKYNVIKNLDLVADQMRTARPRTVLLSTEPSIEGWFLKREGSDCGNHIYGPEEASQLPESQIQRMAKELPFRWIKQEFVPALKQIGEWRVVMVGGRILYILNTSYGGDHNILADLRLAGYTLEEMA